MCIRDSAQPSIRAVSFSIATVSQQEEDVVWKQISSKMLNSLIADGIKSFTDIASKPKPKTKSPDTDSQTTSEQKQVPTLSHTVSAKHQQYSSEHKPVSLTSIPASASYSSSDVDQLFEMEPVKQLLEMISRSKGSVEILRREWLYLIDSGGQPQFHELLPTSVSYTHLRAHETLR